jgi:hypothetical protein
VQGEFFFFTLLIFVVRTSVWDNNDKQTPGFRGLPGAIQALLASGNWRYEALIMTRYSGAIQALLAASNWRAIQAL